MASTVQSLRKRMDFLKAEHKQELTFARKIAKLAANVFWMLTSNGIECVVKSQPDEETEAWTAMFQCPVTGQSFSVTIQPINTEKIDVTKIIWHRVQE